VPQYETAFLILYQRELSGEWGERLVKFGLRVEEVSGQGVANAIRYSRRRPTLSVPGSLALAPAKERRCPSLPETMIFANWLLLRK
jgi:hypothetical protein